MCVCVIYIYIDILGVFYDFFPIYHIIPTVCVWFCVCSHTTQQHTAAYAIASALVSY